MIAGVRIALEIAEQEPLKAVERRPFSVPDADSDEDICAFVRAGRADRLPPDLDVRDRLGRRPRAAGATASRACGSSTPR